MPEGGRLSYGERDDAAARRLARQDQDGTAVTTLRVYLDGIAPGDDAPFLEWVLRDARGEVLSRGRDRLPQLPPADDLELIAPWWVTCFYQISLPVTKGDKGRRLLPFAVEDRVACEPDALHVAVGTTSNGKTHVAVLEKTWIEQVLQLFGAAGLKPGRMLPEILLLENPPDCWSVAWNSREGFVRVGDCAGQMLDGNNPPVALRLLLAEARGEGNAPTRLAVHSQSAEIACWTSELGLPVEQEADWDWRLANSNLASIDLLQGEFASRVSLQLDLRRFWPTLLLLGLIGLLQIGGSIADWWQLRTEKQQLAKTMEQSFRRAFPEETVLVDIPLQMERKLDSLRSSSGRMSENDFIPALARLAPLLESSGGNRLQSIKYEPGMLKAKLAVSSAAAADDLRRRLNGANLKAEVLAATDSKAGNISIEVTLWLR